MAHDVRDLEWQRRYEEQDMPWDRGGAAPPLVTFLEKGGISGRVLVPGCGTGHDVRALGAQANISVVGLDLAPAAIAHAEAQVPPNEASSNLTYLVGDFFQLSQPLVGSFDWLVEHSCFCALPPDQRPDYVAAAVAALRTEGKIFGIFYLTPDVEEGPPFAVARQTLSALFDPHFKLLEEWVPKNCFPGRENRELVRILQKR